MFRQLFILDYVNQLLKVDWDLIIMSTFLYLICGHLYLRVFLTMNGAWVRLYLNVLNHFTIKWDVLVGLIIFYIHYNSILPLLHFTLQIVNTLMSNREYADKMLMYAENHNQVTSSLQIWTCRREHTPPPPVSFFFKGVAFNLLIFLIFLFSPYLEGGHLPKYCSIMQTSIHLTIRTHCWEDLHYTKYAL